MTWGRCDNEWNSKNCYRVLEDVNCRANNVGNEGDNIFYRGLCRNVSEICTSIGLVGTNATHCMNSTASANIPIHNLINRTLSSEEFY